MKKSLYLLGAVLLLTACSNKSGTEPKPASYDDLVSQYEKAAKADAFNEKDYPLVDKQIVDLINRFSGGEADVSHKTIDLDKNGTDELLLGTKVQAGTETLTLYLGAFRDQDGKLVDLLKDVRGADADLFFQFYDNNRLVVDKATEGEVATIVYELTDKGYQELLYQGADVSGDLTDDGQLVTKDREGNAYASFEEQENKLKEVLGHDRTEQIIE